METYCKHNYNGTVVLKLKYKSQCPIVIDSSITYSMAKQNKGLQRQMATGIKNQWQTLESSGPGLTPQLHHLLVSWTWANYLASPNLGSFPC